MVVGFRLHRKEEDQQQRDREERKHKGSKNDSLFTSLEGSDIYGSDTRTAVSAFFFNTA